MPNLNRFIQFFSILIIVNSCSSGSGSSNETSSPELVISYSNLNNLKSYELVNFNINSNLNCKFNISSNDIYWIKTTNNKDFSFRAPVTMQVSEIKSLTIASISSSECPYKSETINFEVNRNPDLLKFLPSPQPINEDETKSDFYVSHGLGFGGIEISDTYSATICYPTPNDCTTYENELFGQDAHNMAIGDFNGDGLEDIVIAWAIFPHTVELSQKINAPVEIYLNDGQGNLYEDNAIYQLGQPPTHPAPYRLAVEDFNGDGIDDIFAGSMGLQYRDPDYSNNFIEPYPDLLLLSDTNGKFYDASSNIDDQNDGNGKLCGFSHDASAGDFDNDGDIDIYACNILLVNDGLGFFTFEANLDRNLQFQYGNPMSSLMVDINNDEYDDLIFWNFDNRWNFENNPHEGHIVLSNGTSNINEWELKILPAGPFGVNHNKYNHADWGDLNNDGYMDVVVAVTRDIPYYEGAYLQILLNDTNGNLIDVTENNFPDQIREASHHGEGNIYLRDFDSDGDLDIFHSTRDYTEINGAHIAINNGNGVFTSLNDSYLPKRPVKDSFSNNKSIAKGLPINLDNEGCLDLISAADVWGDSNKTVNYLYSLININCSLSN